MFNIITIKVNDKESGDLMINFLNKNIKTFGEIAKDERLEESGWKGPFWGIGLSDCPRKNHLGFDYKCISAELEYLVLLVQWMAMTVGERSPKINPQYYYKEKWQRLHAQDYDKFGFPKQATSHYIKLEESLLIDGKVRNRNPVTILQLREEIENLHEQWGVFFRKEIGHAISV